MAVQEEILDELSNIRQPEDKEPTNVLSIKDYWEPITTAKISPLAGNMHFCFLVEAQAEYTITKLIINTATKDAEAPSDTAIMEVFEVTDTATEGIFLIGTKISKRTSTMSLDETRLTIEFEAGTRLEKDKKYLIKLTTRYQEVNVPVGLGNDDTYTYGYWFNVFFTQEVEADQPNQVQEYRIGNVKYIQDQSFNSPLDEIVSGETINFKETRRNVNQSDYTKWIAAPIELWGLNWRDEKIGYQEIVGLAGSGASSAAIEPQQVLIFLLQARAELAGFLKYDFFDNTNWAALTDQSKKLLNNATAYLAAIRIVNYDYDGYGTRFEAREVSNYLQEQADRTINLLRDDATKEYVKTGN